MPDTILPRDGLVIVAKRDCPTCVMVEPVMQSLDRSGPLMVLSQDDPTFPSGVRSVIYDDSLEQSFHLKIEAVPTLIRFRAGQEVERTVGWDRTEWLRVAGGAAEGEGRPVGGGADRALRRDRAEVARHRRRQLGRSDGGLLRARLDRRPAGGAADRRA